MARVVTVEMGEAEGRPQPTTTHARVNIFGAGPNGPTVQIDTFGSKARKVKDEASQTMQFDRQTGMVLLEILEKAYR